ncbi:MAG: sensor histidine kinase [Gemmatimonadales bacterium]
MHTIRGRLASWYALAMGATLFVFGAAVYILQRSPSDAQLNATVRARADLIAAILGEAYLSRDSIVTQDPATGRSELEEDLAALLVSVPDYILVLGRDGDPLFVSGSVQSNDPDVGKIVVVGAGLAVVDKLIDAAQQQSELGGTGSVDLGSPFGEIRFYVRPISSAGDQVTAVISGISEAGLVLRPQGLLIVMLLIAPFVILASVGIAYVLAGRTLQPVDKIVDEVEAITDGRSLHRRLVTPVDRDELSRLTTTLNEMLARLERSFVALRRFTADASHELKTPLTVLRSGIERSITHPQMNPDVLEVLDETLGEVNRMTELVDSLLTLARADEGRAPLHLEPVDLREVLAEIAETGGMLGEQAQVDVTVEVPAESEVISVDRSRFRQLLMNLLTNAIKYTGPGGRVWVRSTRENGTIVVKVKDTGVGIASGELPHIFDRFWRADPARSRAGQRSGAGLGLAISKWIAEAHGGSIQAQSRVGRGTTMTVTLPAGPDHESRHVT